jgi:hypothetical protein
MDWRVFLVCWVAAAAVALALGRDANHDLRSYHYHNAWALLAGRWDVDLAPAGPHSFLHPGLDLPYYLLTRSALNGWPRVVAALQAVHAGLLAFLALAVAGLACGGDARRVTIGSALVAAFGLTGSATLPEVGLSKNDLPIACLVVGALLALLLAAGAEDEARPRRASGLRLLAGALGGAALGLKLTAIIFPPALALAAALAARPNAAAMGRAVALLALGGAAGFALVYGPWGWFLWERFGNPFGPFFNEVFRSPWFPPETPRDTRFLPHDLGQALIYPLLWAGPSEPIVTEPAIADPRFATGLVSLLVAAGLGAWHRRRDRNGHTARRATRAVLAFILVAYLGWLAAYSYLRYAVPIEVLLGIAVWASARAVLLVQLRAGGHGAGRWRAGAALCVGTALGVCGLATRYPHWSREPFFWAGEPRGTAAVAAARVPLPEGSLVAVASKNVSFLAPFLAGPEVRFVGATRWTASGDVYHTEGWTAATGLGRHRLATETRDLLRSHPGPVFLLLEDPDPDPADARLGLDLDAMRAFGIRFDRASCHWVPNNITEWAYLCRSR